MLDGRTRRGWLAVPLAALMLAATISPLSAAPPSDETIAACLRDLDSAKYDTRLRAQEQLVRWAEDAQVAPRLSQRCHALMHRADTSVEVRAALEPLLAELPAVSEAAEVEPAEIDRLLDQLDSDAFAERSGAASRLSWMLEQPGLAAPMMTRLKARWAQPGLSRELGEQFETLYQQARRVWLLSDPRQWQLPPLELKQVEAWIDTLADDQASPTAWRIAERELLDALCRDEDLKQVCRLLDERRTQLDEGSAADKRLAIVQEWTKPEMIAECWVARHHTGIQHLYIGVPSRSPGAERASHFDKIDDHLAHCVSGNSLSPGNYPVGVLFPHPKVAQGQFQLVNLPTPRLRMRYEVYCQTDEATRLAEVSQRTCDALAAAQMRLSERAIQMLAFLDPTVVSRFAGKLLRDVDDAPLELPTSIDRLGAVSHHGMVCYVLANVGTRDALADLRRAIDKRRVLAASDASPFELPWIAALAIAAREPDQADGPWLAELIDRDDRLVLIRDDSPTLGASAAATLLESRGLSPPTFGLESVEDDILDTAGCPAYRYGNAEARERVRRWWQQQVRDAARRP